MLLNDAVVGVVTWQITVAQYAHTTKNQWALVSESAVAVRISAENLCMIRFYAGRSGTTISALWGSWTYARVSIEACA